MAKDIELGKRIAWLRTNRGLEQKAAAEAMGVVYGTYQPYEYGKRPSWRKIEQILSFYQCSRAWLLTGEGIPYPDRPAEKPDSASVAGNVVYMSPAKRLLDEAIAEAGVDLNEAQKAALLKVIQDELARTGDKVKEIIRVFKKED